MRIFVAGATGALGRCLVPVLVNAGHQVAGMTRSIHKTKALEALGAAPVVADALDPQAVLQAVTKAHPDLVIHQLTAIPESPSLRHFDREFALTNRLRTEGLDHLIRAAQTVNCSRIVAQSFGGWPFAHTGGPVKTEEDPLDPAPPAKLRPILDAIRYLENTVTGTPGIEGIALRYGGFYGPGTSLGEGGAMLDQVRQRKVPLVGQGTGVWSFLHIDDAARATLAAVERGKSGIYNIADDDPAPVSQWLPDLAAALGAKPPRHVPAWLARLLIGEHMVVMMNDIRGASNAKAKQTLGWTPQFASWREGFCRGLA